MTRQQQANLLQHRLRDLRVKHPEAPGNLEQKDFIEALAAGAEALTGIETAVRIVEGFIAEDLNGVICSIPEPDPTEPNQLWGLDAPTHRTWCARCKSRWKKAYAFVERYKEKPCANGADTITTSSSSA
jgi:hypothetical protein